MMLYPRGFYVLCPDGDFIQCNSQSHGHIWDQIDLAKISYMESKSILPKFMEIEIDVDICGSIGISISTYTFGGNISKYIDTPRYVEYMVRSICCQMAGHHELCFY